MQLRHHRRHASRRRPGGGDVGCVRVRGDEVGMVRKSDLGKDGNRDEG